MQTEQEFFAAREVLALRCDSVGDYSLPDYNGDIRKVLTVKAKALPSGSFVGDDVLEISGSVAYDVVYLDVENTVTHAEFVTDYDAAVRINSDLYVDSDVHTVVAGYNMRLIGPRKISVKCLLESDVLIKEKRSYEVLGDAFIDGSTEVKTKKVNIASAIICKGETKSVSEVMETVDGAIVDEVEVLMTDATLRVDSADLSDGGIDLKGRVCLTMLYRNALDEPSLITRELSYSETLAVEYEGDLGQLRPRADVTSVKGTVEPGENGVSLVLTAAIVPSVLAEVNEDISLIEDVYLRDKGCSNEYSDFSYTEHIATETAEEPYEYKVALSQLDVDEISEILYYDAHIRVDSCETDEKTVKINGIIKVSAIACQVLENGENTYLPIKTDLPFEQNVNINCQKCGNVTPNCAVDIYDLKMDFDENNIFIKCMLGATVTLNSAQRQRCISASYLTDEVYVKDESVVTVYYPDRNETLFEIAKKFHTSVGEIAARNSLSEEVFASVGEPIGGLNLKRLIIG